ncbi:MAG: hypothetical protein COT43_06550 [Candidatus Marinimicrobia bacterium CG08_land_8_20_14_0_20_45_22]|nr:MAG: hypothetical protein COT43_06550 [Candidatus Marinimicrobia bacterium CG08_land_8_20_14_0_20_45_22]
MKNMKLVAGLIVILLMTMLAQAAESPALQDFDSQVLAARQHMRSYCALIQKVMKSNDEATAQKSLQEIQQAGVLWDKIPKQYAKNPPPEYARDSQFAGRLKTMQMLFDEMAYNVQNKKYQMAFNNCAFACGLFVKMHEENGLVYVSDRLFALRKTIKSAQTLHSNGHSLKEIVPEIQSLRDRVFQAPFPEKSATFTPAMEELSRTIDHLAQQVFTDDKTAIGTTLTELTNQVNDLYALSLQIPS